MSKYNNRKCEYKGMIFDSQRELKRYIELELLQRAGEITDLQRQVKYELIPPNEHFRGTSYIADFVYKEKGNLVCEDVKGMKHGIAYNHFMLKAKLLFLKHNILVRVV